MSKKLWMRYRFHAAAGDYRPVIFPPPGPYWCSGRGEGYSIIVAYLPTNVRVSDYWPEASEIDGERVAEIQFTDRFPEPRWWAEYLAQLNAIERGAQSDKEVM